MKSPNRIISLHLIGTVYNDLLLYTTKEIVPLFTLRKSQWKTLEQNSSIPSPSSP